MGIKVTGTSVSVVTVRFPFMWRNSLDQVHIRRSDGRDVRLGGATTGGVEPAVTSDTEAWSMRLTQVTLVSD